MDPTRVQRVSLSPSDASYIHSRRYTTSQIYDPAAMLFRKAQRESLQSSRSSAASFNSIDFAPSWRSSSSSYMSNYTTPTVYSPNSARSSLRPQKLPSPPKTNSNVTFSKRLPQEVYDCILDQLQTLHSDPLSPSCATCYMRDLHSLGLTNRAWDKAVRAKLYDRIHIVGNDSPSQLKKFKMKQGTRLRLLRRTLRERRQLANLVHELKVPDPDIPALGPNKKPNPQFEEYRDLVASIVMACPNFERLVGFYPAYNHEFDRLTHALSTRKKLKEHVWIITENAAVTERSHCMLPPGLLDQHQVYQFLHHHASWPHLTTLMLHSPGSAGIIESEVFTRLFQLLPSLKHLGISSFDADDFTDSTMLTLLALTSLRLEHLPGLSDSGLSRWAATPAAQSLESLSLIHQDVASLLAISKLLASLPNLIRFTIFQSNVSPALPMELMIFQPLLASPSLKYLHWDVASPNSLPTQRQTEGASVPEKPAKNLETPNTHLALSILHSGFPSLLSLRAPLDIDPQGALQAVCRPTPNAQILLPADRYSLPPSSRAPNAAMPATLPGGNSLHLARIRAQSFIDAAAKEADKPFMKVVVTYHSNSPEPIAPRSRRNRFSDPEFEDLYLSDEDEIGPPPGTAISHSPDSEPVKIHEFTLPPFIGRVHASAFSFAPRPPRFNLLPDIPGNDAEGGVVGWKDLLGMNNTGEKVGTTSTGAQAYMKDGCTGTWNQQHRGGREWWGHTERERRAILVEAALFFN